MEDLKDACPLETTKPLRVKMDIETDEEKDETSAGNLPVQNTYCSIPTCTAESVRDRDCDFKLFVSWLGSDINHKKLISNAERFMIYSSYNLDVLFNTILKIAKPQQEDGEPDRDKGRVVIDPLHELEQDVRKRITTTHEVTFQELKVMSEI